jgi:hypothetical protein
MRHFTLRKFFAFLQRMGAGMCELLGINLLPYPELAKLSLAALALNIHNEERQ